MAKKKAKKAKAQKVHIPAVPVNQRLQEAARARSPAARLKVPLVSKKTTTKAKPKRRKVPGS